MITHQRLTQLLSYDPETGIFRYRVPQGRMRVGDQAGTVRKDGRRQIGLDGRIYLAGRLAWLHFYGVWPQNLVDHENGQRDQNGISNLRDATHEQNMRNAHSGKGNKTGVRGVYLEPRTGRYYAQIRDGGKVAKALGTFETIDEAAAARRDAVRQIHGEFASPLG